jgi:hypothetical protein
MRGWMAHMLTMEGAVRFLMDQIQKKLFNTLKKGSDAYMTNTEKVHIPPRQAVLDPVPFAGAALQQVADGRGQRVG